MSGVFVVGERRDGFEEDGDGKERRESGVANSGMDEDRAGDRD